MTSRCCSSEKVVLVAVYAERPRRSHHHRYHDFNQNVCKNDRRVRGNNRRGELLDYSRHLRASAQSAVASASLPSHPFSHVKQLSTVDQISSADRKQKHPSLPSCLDKWECLIPSFLRSITALNTSKDRGKKNHNKSVSTATKMKALVRSLQVQKKGDFLSELLRKLRNVVRKD